MHLFAKRKNKQKGYLMAMDSVIEKLDVLLNDSMAPRTVKKSAEQARAVLLNESEKDLNVKKNEAFSILEEVSDDQNIPIPVMTKIWAVFSELEAI